MGRQVSKAELAEIVGRDERTLSRWQNEGMPVRHIGLGRGNENQYDTEEVIGWLVQVASLNGAKESPKDRLDRLRGDQAELAMAKELDLLVVADELIDQFEAMITAAKVELINTFPENLAAELSARYGLDVDEQLIRDPIEAVLRELANYDPDDDEAPDGDHGESDDPEEAD